MGNGYDGLSPSDVALLTNRNNNDSGWGSGDGWLIILLLLALGGFGGYGFGGFGGMGGFGGAMGADFMMYPWLSNGQKEIMQNTNQGFDTLQLSNQIEGTRDAIHNVSTQLCDGFHGVSNQICNSTANLTSAITNGFYGAEISANNRQMADMQQNYNNQLSTLQGFNGLQGQLAQCLKKILIKAKEFLYFTKNEAVGTCMA